MTSNRDTRNGLIWSLHVEAEQLTELIDAIATAPFFGDDREIDRRLRQLRYLKEHA